MAHACGELLKPEFDVIGTVRDGRTLLEVAAQLRPDLVLIHIAIPELNGLDATALLRQRQRSIRVVILTVTVGADAAAEAFRRGASGYVVKHSSGQDLVVAVRRVLRGESFLSPQINKDEVDFLLRSCRRFHHEKQLTARQRDVLRLLAQGKTPKEISNMLRIRTHTVFFHKYKMIKTLNLRTTAELIQYAIYQGIA